MNRRRVAVTSACIVAAIALACARPAEPTTTTEPSQPTAGGELSVPGPKVRAAMPWSAGAESTPAASAATDAGATPEEIAAAASPPPRVTTSRPLDPCVDDATLRSTGCVDEDHDEFRGTDEVIAMFVVEDGRRVSIDAIRGRASATLNVHSRSEEGWVYLRCHPLDLLVDGHRVPTTEPRHDGEVHEGAGVSEDVDVVLGATALAQVLAARQFRGRVCDDEFELTTGQVATLHRFGERLRAPRSPVARRAGARP